MKVQVKVFSSLQELSEKEVNLDLPDGATVSDVLYEMTRRSPGLSREILGPSGMPADHITILLNGRNIRHLAGPLTGLADGDLIAIFPPSGGG
ncbi:MAG: MoaD family protein [Methanoregulaceae archaeon]|nr:MoaD family protein [Methanoregulaceae archaeon]